MLTYAQLEEKQKELLAMTSLTAEEFNKLLAVFEKHLAALSPPPELTKRGQPRKRKQGGGAKERLATSADKLLFILVYQKTYPIQTMQGLLFGLSQSRANYWIHRLMPILDKSLAELGAVPERDPEAVAESPLVNESAADLLIDGTERRIQRPKDDEEQKEHYSGKKKTHTDKNIVLVNSHSKKVVYLGPTENGKKHDKKIADENDIAYPSGATLAQDTGFQGYQPAGVTIYQPKKSPGAENWTPPMPG